MAAKIRIVVQKVLGSESHPIILLLAQIKMRYKNRKLITNDIYISKEHI